MLSRLFLTSFVFSLICGTLGALELTGTSEKAEIIIPAQAALSTKRAAEEFAEYTQKVSGEKLAIKTGTSESKKKVYIGTVAAWGEQLPAAIRAKLEKAKPDSFVIKTQGDTLWIIGKNEVAEVYGTSYFLEKMLGIRFLIPPSPEDNGEYVPQCKKIVIPEGEIFKEPAFRERYLSHLGYWNVTPKKGILWAVRNGYQIHIPYNINMPYTKEMDEFYRSVSTPEARHIIGGHGTFPYAIPADKYFKTNPEYFALLNGKRQLYCGNQKGYYQYCISNPEVQQLVVDYILKEIRKYPENEVTFGLGLTDLSTGWCECAECKKLDGNVSGTLNISTRFHTVVAQIAAKVYEKMPTARLRVWAYHTYRDIPECPSHDSRMLTQYCIHGRCYGHKLDDPNCRRNVSQFALMKEWRKRSNRFYLYEYFLSPPQPMYVARELNQAYDLRILHKLGIGYKEEAFFPDGKFPGQKKDDPRLHTYYSNWQWFCVTGKLLWDPNLDENEIIADLESKYYLVAYPAMKKYHDYRRLLWANTGNCMGYPTGDQRSAFLLNTPGSKEKLLGYLQEAEKLAKSNPVVLKRIARDRMYLERHWIQPNEEMRKKAGNVFSAPEISGKIVIDGKGDDAAWLGAYYTSDFMNTVGDVKKPAPEEVRTTVGILSDERNLYFLIKVSEPEVKTMNVTAKEKDSLVWRDESVEIFLYPPTAANSYYQIAVNPAGTVYDAICPNPDTKFDFGIEAATKINGDSYTVEMRVPVSAVGEFKRGNVWKAHFCRGRKNQKTGKTNYSIDGAAYHDTASYRPLVIGSPYIKNGSFDKLNGKGVPESWSLIGKYEIVKEGKVHAVRLQNGTCSQYLLDPALAQSPKERKIKITFQAEGSSWIDVGVNRYTDTKDNKAPHGYRRTFHPSVTLKRLFFRQKSGIFTLDYTIPANEWVRLYFNSPDALIRNVSVTLEE